MNDFFTHATVPFMEIVSLAVMAVLGFAANKARQKWGIDIEAKHRDALHEALMTAARLAIGRNLTGQAAISLILDYAKRSVPDALDKLSPPAMVIENLAQSKLEKAAVEAGKAIGEAIKASR